MKTISMAFASAAALLIGTAPASAALVESVSVENRFGYNFTTSGDPIVSEGGNKETVFVGQRAPTPTSDLGVDYVGTAGDGQFFFLHNNYCVGACSTVSSTTISFTVTNTGDADVDLRFDSLITPGHLARVDGPSAARGGFDFEVTQHPLDSDDITTLYSAFGNANDEELTVGGPGGSNEPFRGQVRYELAGGRVLDWDTTPLNLELGTLAAGATTVVEYTASYFVTSFDSNCDDITSCGGLQVVFGDPRNNGSVTTFARGRVRHLGGRRSGDDHQPRIRRG